MAGGAAGSVSGALGAHARADGAPEPAARRLHLDPDALGRWLGRDHDRQEHRAHRLRAARPQREGEPEVRLREEGPADHLLRHPQPRSAAPERRAQARGCGALPGPERVPQLRSAGGARRGRRVRHPERPGRRGAVEIVSGGGAERHPRTGDQGLLPGRLPDCDGGGHGPGASLPDAGGCVPGGVLRGFPDHGAGEPGQGRPVRGDSRPADEEVRAPGRTGRGGQPARHPARLRRAPRGPDSSGRRYGRRRGRGAGHGPDPDGSGRGQRPARDRQPRPLLGAGLRPLPGRPGPDRRSVRRDQRHAGGHEHDPGHDGHPVRGAGVHPRALHRVQPVLGAVPGRRDPRPRELGGGRDRHGDPRGGQRQASRPDQAGLEEPRPRIAEDPAGRAIHDVRRRHRVGVQEPRGEAELGRRAAAGSGRGVRGRLLGAGRLPAGEDSPVLRCPRADGEGQRRPAVDHREPGRVQGVQPLRRCVPRGRTRHGAAERGDRRPAAAELEAVGAPAGHPGPLSEHHGPRRGDRRPSDAPSEEGDLPLDGGW